MPQAGEKLSMPHSPPLPILRRRCHELRVRDEKDTCRIIYRLDSDAVIIVEVFSNEDQHHTTVGD